jgi:hypothetical protein
VLPAILALDKPMYRACQHIRDQGCGLFGQPERPQTCISYACAYLAARLAESPDRNHIPHPLEAGAYFHRDPAEKAVVVFVDPKRPDLWKATAIPDFLRHALSRRETIVLYDRGHQMTLTAPEQLEAVLARDFVAFVEAEGRKPDIASFQEFV